MRHHVSLLALVFVSVIAFSSTTLAQLDGLAICTDTSDQSAPVIVSDGAGGAILVWSDQRSGAATPDIYAQRVNAGGDPQWTLNGIQVTDNSGADIQPAVISDGAGGAIIAWQNGALNGIIYAQRIDATGSRLWPKINEGVAVTFSGFAEIPDLAADGSGGAIVTWRDSRSGNLDIYARRVDSSGVPQWTNDGVALCTAANDQYFPGIVSDGAGGAIIAWTDERAGFDIYAQRVNASGAAQWTGNGVLLGATIDSLDPNPLVADGAGGAIVTWDTDPVNLNIAAQRVNAAGAAQWGGGVLVCTATNLQGSPRIAPDGAAGAIITWQDLRTGTNRDLYAQHLNASGAPQWLANGVALTSGTVQAEFPFILSNGTGGAVVAWQDYRSGAANRDIYARGITASGHLSWPADGTPLCTASGNQLNPRVESDGVTAIVAWRDHRGSSWDIYALPTGVLTGVRDTPSLSALELTPNFPNPFVDGTTMDLDLPARADVNVDVFNVAGRRVRHQAAGTLNAGWREIRFDGRDDAGQLLPSGVYFYRVHAAEQTVTEKMVIAR
jgi:FlgD Ig-like domain